LSLFEEMAKAVDRLPCARLQRLLRGRGPGVATAEGNIAYRRGEVRSWR